MSRWNALWAKPASRQIAAISAVAVAVGISGGWAWDSTEPARLAAQNVVIESGTDPSTYVYKEGVLSGFTVPIRNDSTFPVTVTFLDTPGMPAAYWNGEHVVIPAGGVMSVPMQAPLGCTLSTVTKKVDAPVDVHVIVAAPNANTYKFSFTVVGAVQAIEHRCGHPYPSAAAF
jgi:hypothetical protein